MKLDVYRKDFPMLDREEEDKKLIYFDNACMTLKPKVVIDKIIEYYTEYSGCGGRSLHSISSRVTEEYDNARKITKDFINAPSRNGIIFTKNTTESINLLSNSFPFKKGDRVLGTDHEHNSNLVPWLKARDTKGIIYDHLPSKKDHSFDLELFKEMVKGVKLVSMVHVSNLDGRVIPIKDIVEISHDAGATVFFDCAQSIPHMAVDMKGLDIDLIAFSGHKACGPTGTGVLAGKIKILEEMDTFIVGGDTVQETTYDRVDFLKPPYKFEAGLQNYAGMIGMGAGLKYLKNIGLEEIHSHEIELNRYVTELLADEVEIMGPEDPADRGGIFPFQILGLNAHDISMIVDEVAGIAMRSGRHCVHSWFNGNKVESTARASFYIYNTKEEIEIFTDSILQIKRDFL